MPKEIELKLSLPAHCVKHLLHIPLLDNLSISAPPRQKLHTVYYDTPELTLKNQRCALRLRQSGNVWIQTIKTEGSAASGLHERDEWEVPLAGNQLDFSQLSDPVIPKFFSDPALREQLRPIFRTEFTRQIRILQPNKSDQIELCIDRGKIITDHLKEPFAEIELELKTGNPVALFKFALLLAQSFTFPIRLENRSKAERGYSLYTGHQTPPVKAQPIVLTADMDPTEAFVLIAQNCLAHLTKNEQGTLAGDDIEYLHQMRVALRRLRSAFDIFSSVLHDPEPLVHELKWLTRQFNPARDWDVFVMEHLSLIQKNFAKHSGILSIRKVCEKLRQSHNKTACYSIRSKRYLELILQLNLWLAELLPYSIQLSAQQRAKTTLKKFTTSLLTERHEHILGVCQKIEELDASSLHALRISIKKQRYAVDFLQTLYSPKAAKQYIKTLSTLQDILGALNDSTTINKLLGEIPKSKANTLTIREAIGIILGWNKQQIRQKKTELKHALPAFCNSLPFWRTHKQYICI
ncbi:CYTH domain-containing protein [Nitrosomonas nitrosa]|uniref:CYTH domain-containing protein n=1 Tax=Nitrosomonas nitrosa TaxID=52442 RepID=A0A8H8YYL2_9PROT|nr:CYTH and CHAD domain-containing protein [Nitrosomonas nitrosa]CAE6483756.1 CYTH domain-containing protein [Nitrosomonas nitrosa]